MPPAWPDGPAEGEGDTVRPDPSVRLVGQPAAATDGGPRCEDGLAMVADARLDDRAGLCDALGVPHPQRAGLADGALIARAWRRWGRECPNHLLGDYAFALWDAKARTLFCARDHIGARPFHYSLTADRFVFASDLDGVLAAPGVPGELDEAVVVTRLASPGSPLLGARTFFRAVRRLPPGHWLAVGRDAARLERWWRPEDAPPAHPASDDEYAEAFLEVYARAVRDRLCGPHRVGVHLSGGLDSSSIAVLAARERRRRGRPAPPAFSWLPPPGDGPRGADEAAEYGAIEAVCAQEGLPVFHRSPSPADVLAALRRDGARGADESTLVHEEVVQRCAAEQGVRVLLSGWGGDEGISFNGRGYYQHLLSRGRLIRCWRELREHPSPFRFAVWNVVLPFVHPRAGASVRALLHGGGPIRRPTFIHPGFARRVEPLPGNAIRPVGVRRMQLNLLERGHLARRMEGWAASGARHGIEYRYPLLDRRVLELALGLPPEQFRRGRWSRWLMRHALRSVLPPEVCWNPSKRDPTRYESLIAATAEALPAIRRALEARAAPPSRARYVDMPRLMASLDADRFRERPGPIRSTLQFLDF